MKLKIVLTLVFVTGLLSAQYHSEYNYYYYWKSASNKSWKRYQSKDKDLPYTQKKETTTNSKGDSTIITSFFNEAGALLKLERVKDGKLKHAYEAIYNEDGTVSRETIMKKGKKPLEELNYYDENGKVIYSVNLVNGVKAKYKETYEYNNLGYLTSMTRYKKGTEEQFSHRWEYNSDSALIASKYIRKDKLCREWKYEYYGKRDKSKSVLYNGKGKLLMTWTYDCKPEGEEVKPKEKEKLICKLRTAEDGYLVDVTETFNEKGKTVKTIYKYNAQDTSLVYMCYYYDGMKGSEVWYGKGWNNPLKRIYYQKGKEYSKWIYTRENGLLLKEEYYRKDKLISKKINRYQDELMVSSEHYNKKGELSYKSEFTYVMK